MLVKRIGHRPTSPRVSSSIIIFMPALENKKLLTVNSAEVDPDVHVYT